MGQSDVLDYLARHRNVWIPVKQVQNAFKGKISDGSVAVSIKKLQKGNFIKVKIVNNFEPRNNGPNRHRQRYVKYNC